MKTVIIDTKRKKENFFKKVDSRLIIPIARSKNNEHLIMCCTVYKKGVNRYGREHATMRLYDFSALVKK